MVTLPFIFIYLIQATTQHIKTMSYKSIEELDFYNPYYDSRYDGPYANMTDEEYQELEDYYDGLSGDWES